MGAIKKPAANSGLVSRRAIWSEAHAHQISLVRLNHVRRKGRSINRSTNVSYHHGAGCWIAVIQHGIQLQGKSAGYVIGTYYVGPSDSRTRGCVNWRVGRQGVGYPDRSANRVLGNIIDCAGNDRPSGKTCQTDVLPEQITFVGWDDTVPVAFNQTVANG